MRFSISSVLFTATIAGLMLGWYLDHQRLTETNADLQFEAVQLRVVHKDKKVRRQYVLGLISGEPDENIPALITALADEDIRIAMEARAGLELMTKMSFRTQIPNSATTSKVRAIMLDEQTRWKNWLDKQSSTDD